MDIDKKIAEIDEYIKRTEIQLREEREAELDKIGFTLNSVDDTYLPQKLFFSDMYLHIIRPACDAYLSIYKAIKQNDLIQHYYDNCIPIIFMPYDSGSFENSDLSEFIQKTDQLLQQTKTMIQEDYDVSEKIQSYSPIHRFNSFQQKTIETMTHFTHAIVNIETENRELLQKKSNFLAQEFRNEAQFYRATYMVQHIRDVIFKAQEIRKTTPSLPSHQLSDQEKREIDTIKAKAEKLKKQAEDLQYEINAFESIKLPKTIQRAKSKIMGSKKIDEIVNSYCSMVKAFNSIHELLYNQLTTMEDDYADELSLALNTYDAFFDTQEEKISKFIESLDKMIHTY